MSCLLVLISFTSLQPAEPRDSSLEPPRALPLCTTVYPQGVATESDYLRSLSEEHDVLLRSAQQADAAAAPRWHAYHAEWILAVRCEPLLTRLILDISEEQDLSTLADQSGQALEFLDQAKASWPEEDSLGKEHLDLLVNFARGGVALAQSRQSKPDQEAMSRIANELAVWIDDDNAEIASAALLWSSLLYHEAGRTERAFQLLPLALEPVEGRVGDFYLRLLRCVLLAKSQRSTLALALLLKMEERCEGWLPGEALQHSALCTLAWLRARIGATGSAAVEGVARQSLSDWLRRAQDVIQDAETPCTLLRLRQAAPMLFPKPIDNQESP